MIVLAKLKAENICNAFTVVSYTAVVCRSLCRCRCRNSAAFDISAIIAHESVNLIVTIHNHLSTANRAFHNLLPPILGEPLIWFVYNLFVI